jgi:multimeric flavodoxin WrbA
MRIVAINSSHRGDKGLTRFFLDRLVHGAAAAGADCEVITLAKLRMNRCISCRRCQTGEPHLRCVYHDKDDVAMVFEKMAGADLLIFATPIYMMAMASLLKVFLERMYSTMDISDVRLSSGLIHHHINPALSSKPFVVLVVCVNVEKETWKSVTSYFRTYARFMEARQAGVLVRNACELFDPQKQPASGQDSVRLSAVCTAYEQAGCDLATRGFIRRSTQRAANQEVVPVPFFRLLKHFRPVKNWVVEYARKQSK